MTWSICFLFYLFFSIIWHIFCLLYLSLFIDRSINKDKYDNYDVFFFLKKKKRMGLNVENVEIYHHFSYVLLNFE